MKLVAITLCVMAGIVGTLFLLGGEGVPCARSQTTTSELRWDSKQGGWVMHRRCVDDHP